MAIIKHNNGQKGQILLIVVLAAVISLTVGLSAVSRTITNTRVSTEEANSQKALSAAEAGIEELINKENFLEGTGLKSLSNQSKFNAVATDISGDNFLVDNGQTIKQDDGADVWLSTYPNFTAPFWSGTMTVLYKDNDGCSVSGNQVVNPAIEVVVISGTNRNIPNMTRTVYDNCGRSGGNFNNPSDGSFTLPAAPNVMFNHRFNVVINNGFIARIVPLYADTTLGVQSSVSLPAQGYVFESTGTAGNTTRKVEVYQGFPKLPIEFFPYNLFLP